MAIKKIGKNLKIDQRKKKILVGLPIDPLIATVESSFKDTQLTVPA